jgi:hypothetical protein
LSDQPSNHSRTPVLTIAFIAIVAGIVYSNNHSDEKKPAESSTSHTFQRHSDANNQTFHGYDCTVDCSGHSAGYKWAEDHYISDGDDCDVAGEHSNSPSFAEGCHAYVDGDSETEDDNGPDKNDSDDPDEEN